MVFQDSCEENREQLKRGEVERRARGSMEEDEEREMELLGGFHGVRTSRGPSVKVCLSQRGAGDDSHPSRCVFLSCLSPTHSRYHTDVLMRLRSTGCHTCIHHMLIM